MWRDFSDNKKGFFRYISNKRKIRESGLGADWGGCPGMIPRGWRYWMCSLLHSPVLKLALRNPRACRQERESGEGIGLEIKQQTREESLNFHLESKCKQSHSLQKHPCVSTAEENCCNFLVWIFSQHWVQLTATERNWSLFLETTMETESLFLMDGVKLKALKTAIRSSVDSSLRHFFFCFSWFLTKGKLKVW